MPTINVLKEILSWSSDRPPWQRDALRRLVTQGDLEEADVADLADLCKARHGLAEKRTPTPLESKHLPDSGPGIKPVSLTSLTHHRGVNALGQDQTIEFGPALTVVYGENAAGKSGYTRILKRACRARGAEEILGNVVAGNAPNRPSATIKYAIDGEARDLVWDDDQPPDISLSRVSVFDRHCASVYVAQQTDVAFRPLGLDLFDKLSGVCETVKQVLDKERKILAAETLELSGVPDGTQVHELLSHLTSLTNPDAVRNLAALSDADRTQIADLRKRLHELQSDDPQKTARALELRAKRTGALAAKIKAVAELLSDGALAEIFSARDRVIELGRAAADLHRGAFEHQPLPDTGSAAWRALWDAAERFSSTNAYPDESFPVTLKDSRCVLCQQELKEEAAQRLRQFHEFLTSTVQRQRDEATAKYRDDQKRLTDLVVNDESTEEGLEELELEDSALADALRAALGSSDARRQAVMTALSDGSPCPSDLPDSALNAQPLLDLVAKLNERATELKKANHQEVIAKFQGELRELEARQVLADNLEAVLNEIERKKKIAAYELCIKDTTTNAITKKSTEVTKQAVTDHLAKSFKDNLSALSFRHIEVEMVPARGSRGSLFHKLQLRRAPGVSVPSVVSEGEARCLSIASFFAELSTAAEHSAILFDDPVSSLDHVWRGNVAERLVVEAESRQVVVFTHDIVFLLAIAEKAEKHGVDLKHQHLRRDSTTAGLSSQRLPWAVMKVKDRIGQLKALFQDADKLHRDGDQTRYEKEASYIYGALRETWERAVEEVLLVGVVERFRNSVQTQQAKHLADICDDDCRALDAGMTKSSMWLTGHDQAAAQNAPFPEPSDLLDDITALENWVKAIRKRRGN